MKFAFSLSIKIIAALISVLIVVLAVITYYNIEVQTRQHLSSIQTAAFRSSDFLKKSMHSSMLRNQRDDLKQMIRNLGSEPGMERIRIYNKLGFIMFSSDSSEIGRRVNKTADACIMCHGRQEGFGRSEEDKYVRVYESPAGGRLLGLINPIRNEPSCVNEGCHGAVDRETILGVLDVQMSLKGLDQYITESRMTLLLSSIATLIAVGVVSAVLIIYLVRRPIKKFMDGTRAIGAGDLDHTIILETRDELGELAVEFNTMVTDLKQARAELTQWSDTLVQRVEEKTRELKAAHSEILHMEKMASLGKLSASIAHEINNPLSGILTFAKLIKKQVQNHDLDPKKIEKVLQEVSLIADEAHRCGDIVKDLLFFARKQNESPQPSDINELIRKSVTLVHHRLEMQQIALATDLAEPAPVVVCDASHIQQALIALFVNAMEAMPEGGALTVTSRPGEKGTVRIDVSDTGCGIEDRHIEHIFEPFFTTKESASGVGLGLAIVYGIIQNHHGTIRVASRVNQGSTFTITLPLEQVPASSPTETRA